jgi:hypothetical protein
LGIASGRQQMRRSLPAFARVDAVIIGPRMRR